MRVYVTGIEGMLGSAIADLHRQAGDEVFGCDIEGLSGAYALCDIRDEAAFRREIKAARPDVIYHCAAMLGVQNTEQHPEVCRQINSLGTTIVAKVAAETGAAVVFLSSSEVYGNQRGPLSEGSALLGDNVYAISKVEGEATMHRLASRGNRVTICRMFNCFGPRQVRQFFIPKIIDRALNNQLINIFGNPQNMRSYLLSHDAARFIIDCGKSDRDDTQGAQTFNVAHPNLVTLGYVVDRVLTLTKSKSNVRVQDGDVYEDRVRARDVPFRVADTTRLQAISKHRPVATDDALSFAVRTHGTTRADWTYPRVVL